MHSFASFAAPPVDSHSSQSNGFACDGWAACCAAVCCRLRLSNVRMCVSVFVSVSVCVCFVAACSSRGIGNRSSATTSVASAAALPCVVMHSRACACGL